MLAHKTPTQHSRVIGHRGLAGVACQSSVTLNTTSLGSVTNRDSWCLNYQGLLCLLSSSVLLVLFPLWHLSLFFQVKGQQGHMLPYIWKGGSQVKGASVHTPACSIAGALDVGAFISKTIDPFTITSTVCPWKHKRPLGQERHSGFILSRLIYWSYFWKFSNHQNTQKVHLAWECSECQTQSSLNAM